MRGKRLITAALGVILAAVIALVAMVGVFWLLDILPLAGLLGLAVYYAFSAGRRQSTHWRS